MLKWLIDYLSGPWAFDAVLQHAFQAGKAADDFHRHCFTADRVWLDQDQAQEASLLLGRYIVHYHAAARECWQCSLLFFNLTPKVHYLMHMLDDLRLVRGQRYVANPALWSTQMDEDHVGVSSRRSRSTHAATVAKRTGDKWLVYVRRKWGPSR